LHLQVHVQGVNESICAIVSSTSASSLGFTATLAYDTASPQLGGPPEVLREQSGAA